MSLLDQPKPVTVKNARVVSFGNLITPAAEVERQKDLQRKHWKKNDRRRK